MKTFGSNRKSNYTCANASTKNAHQTRYLLLNKSKSEVITNRGFKPSDCSDPNKRDLLISLSAKIWGRENERQERRADIGTLLTCPPSASAPAPEYTSSSSSCPIRLSAKKMYGNSCFYSAKQGHPTVEDQLQMARKISRSLSDVSNRRSKGQSMFVSRRNRSRNWIHQASNAGDEENENNTADETVEEIETEKALRLVMNPRGHVQDLESLKQQGIGVDIEPALSPEICWHLIEDMNATKGKGAELFAKRKKRSEKWIFDGSGDSCADDSAHSINSSNTAIRNQSASNVQGECFTENNANSSGKRINGNGECASTFSDNLNVFSDSLYKPRVPRGWKADFHKESQLVPHQVHGYERSLQKPNQSEYTCDKPSVTHSFKFNAEFAESNRNYNTAPRGWKPSMTFYRPITFEKKFTDF